jgi:hypothetical protein
MVDPAPCTVLNLVKRCFLCPNANLHQTKEGLLNKKGQSVDASSLSRRGFLPRVGGTAGAALAPAALLGSTNKSGSRVVSGNGAHTYELVPGWGQLPNGVKYGYAHGVQIDSHNRVIVHNQSKDSSGAGDEAAEGLSGSDSGKQVAGSKNWCQLVL